MENQYSSEEPDYNENVYIDKDFKDILEIINNKRFNYVVNTRELYTITEICEGEHELTGDYGESIRRIYGREYNSVENDRELYTVLEKDEESNIQDETFVIYCDEDDKPGETEVGISSV